MSNLVRLLIFCSYLCQLLYCCHKLNKVLKDLQKEKVLIVENYDDDGSTILNYL